MNVLRTYKRILEIYSWYFGNVHYEHFLVHYVLSNLCRQRSSASLYRIVSKQVQNMVSRQRTPLICMMHIPIKYIGRFFDIQQKSHYSTNCFSNKS